MKAPLVPESSYQFNHDLLDWGRNRRFWITTYGCQMNEHDSEILAGQLQQMGFEPADYLEQADLILLNTCAIRERAAEKTAGEIGRLKALKSVKPELMIGVCGCLAQVEEFVHMIKRQAPHVDLVFGTHNLHELPELIRRAQEEPEMVVDVWSQARETVENLPKQRAEGVKAWVNIIYGCDKYCTYCIVPRTRGRERSRQPQHILEEVRELAEQGYKEITLLGQNVNSYGKDLGGDYDFADLLADLEKIEGIRWIRYMTSHPRDFNEKLIEVLAASEKICEHVHLPVQSGSNQILKKMNRRYTREHYLSLIEMIREKLPHASLTTDIIVGFPGETEADFQQTLDLVEQVGYDNAYTFIYSPRPGTPAARWEDPTPEAEKKERLNRLMDLQYAISRRHNEMLVGKRMEVLIEGESKKDPLSYTARSRTNKLIHIPRAEGMEGKFATVEIDQAHTWTLRGRLVKEAVCQGSIS